MWNRHNVHKMLINIYRNPKYTTFTKLVQVRNFITFELKVIRHGERETQSFYADCFYKRTNLSVLAQLWISTLSFGSRNSTHCFFSNLSPHSGAWRHSHPLVPIPIWDFYFDISEWHILSVRVWTPALMLHLTNPCTEPKGSHPN